MSADQKMDLKSGINSNKETILLLHGMGRTRASLGVMQVCLKWAGFEVLSFSYSPRRGTLDEISQTLTEYIQEYVKTPTYHFVAHSLGNIIIRNSFKGKLPPGAGRMVMLAPPNRPAHLARTLKDNILYRFLHGDSGQKLACEHFYQELPIPSLEFGIIAGSKGQKLTFKEPNDGIISVESTKLEGMKDWIQVHHTHTFLMNCKDTIDYTLNFLRQGRFQIGESEIPNLKFPGSHTF